MGTWAVRKTLVSPHDRKDGYQPYLPRAEDSILGKLVRCEDPGYEVLQGLAASVPRDSANVLPEHAGFPDQNQDTARVSGDAQFLEAAHTRTEVFQSGRGPQGQASQEL